MSGAVRSACRDAVRTALASVPGFQRVDAWTQTVDRERLPAWAVATPSSRHTRIDHDGTIEATVTVAVIVKRQGQPDVLETELDADADTFAPLIIAAIQTDSRDCELTDSAMRIDRDGEMPTGTLTLQFSVTAWT